MDQDQLITLHEENRNCRRCSLSSQCSNVVPGVGPATTELILVGEAPGQDEDLFGEPFVGRAGKLLDTLLNQAGLDRQTIYITNTVCCNPTVKRNGRKSNRAPEPHEIEACKYWLWQKLKLIEPQVIVTLGKVPTGLLLGLPKNFKMKEVVGILNWPSYIGSVVIPAYHPSYLLRGNKKDFETTKNIFQNVAKMLKE